MALDVTFNDSSYRTMKVNDFVLGVSYYMDGTTQLLYDFAARVMVVRTGSSDGGAVVKPFSELDPDSLETMHRRLVDLGGKPPVLPAAEAMQKARLSRSLNP